MTTLDAIVDKLRDASRADFAFVLTRRGRLATRDAPQDMPERGRRALIAIAEAQLRDKRGAVSHVELPREQLVPYGGAAPVDVYLAAREEAILCAVLATFTEQREVAEAMTAGAAELDKLLAAEAERRARRRSGVVKKDKEGAASKEGKAPAARGSSPGKRRLSSAPPARGTLPFGDLEDDDREPFEPAPPSFDPDEMPTITISETKPGRATLAAIEIDRDAPEITYGQATVGRQTLGEIELSLLPSGSARSSTPDIRLDVVSLPMIEGAELDVTDRSTLPFTERPEDAKRRFELAERLRLGVGPVVLDQSKTRTVIAGKSKPAVKPEAKRSGQTKAPAASKAAAAAAATPMPRDSNIELWHSALASTLVDEPAVMLDEPTTRDDGPPTEKTPSRPPPRSTGWSRSAENTRTPTTKETSRGKSVWPSGPSKSTAPKKGKAIPPAAALPTKRPSDKPKR